MITAYKPTEGIKMLFKSYTYAVVNGYKGTYAEYVRLNYDGYCEICRRCDVWPMSFEAWSVSQSA